MKPAKRQNTEGNVELRHSDEEITAAHEQDAESVLEEVRSEFKSIGVSYRGARNYAVEVTRVNYGEVQ